ncbi:MAG: NADH-quinone oxidoreductase subunit J [Magnetococcales bacterium]|nr:NADH-quinone oxidoreductase subunit J [Magnetococcales bacterium]
MVADFVFYLFALITVVAALGVITVRNPVHSVLLLVLTFFTTAALFVLIGAEFLAAILIMVYMGAVAVLFLFVVMMLDLDFAQLRQGAVKHLPLGITVGLVILAEMVIIALSHHGTHVEAGGVEVENTLEIGRVLFTRFLYPFEIVSVVLLVAIIGAVALTFREGARAKRQNIADQLARTRDDAIELVDVASGEGASKP